MNLKTAEFFREHGFKSPIDALNTPAQQLYNVKGKTHMIQLLQQHAEPQALANMMATWMLDRPHWSDGDFYPVKERLIQDAAGDDDSVFLVDMGGSRGHDLEKFLARHPSDSFPGHLLLQDLGEVITSIADNSLPPGMRAIPHDFFTPQPAAGECSLILNQSVFHS